MTKKISSAGQLDVRQDRRRFKETHKIKCWIQSNQEFLRENGENLKHSHLLLLATTPSPIEKILKEYIQKFYADPNQSKMLSCRDLKRIIQNIKKELIDAQSE